MKKMDFEIVVLGGGPAGYMAAIRASQLGATVALIEEREIGGVCLNRGCIPTKSLLKTGEIAKVIKSSKEYGIESSIQNINWEVAVERKNRVVKNLNNGLEQMLLTKGITILKGMGIVENKNRLIVRNEDKSIEVNCNKLILATGAKPMLPNIKGIDLEGVITSNEAINLKNLPASMMIVGGGVIGLEFASMLNSLGVKITVVELLDGILPNEDDEIVKELQKTLKRQGISFKFSAKVNKIEKTHAGLEVTYTSDDKINVQTCDKVLIAVGRKLNSELFENLSLEIKNGAIVVNESMETNQKGVYAAGDLTGGRLVAHLAFAEGKTAAENALGVNSKVNYMAVPTCIYTNPEVASVGFTENSARQAGIDVKVGRFNFRNNGRALTLGEREGFVKVIVDQENTIIGGQILETNASELISEITLAITLKAKADILANMIHPHPGLNEAIWEACSDAIGFPIHKL
ncbi:MAG: dihydrolipoyl dehydrogenase [Peptostreptococcaceae bacterium]|nr:dihydrolipoyl dehydrogenase [Peptostreptococcaceae bacterium]